MTISKISLIHDYLSQLMTSLLPTYTQLPNPYFAIDNPELFLRKGFGIAVDAGNRTDRHISCHTSWERAFSIILTNQVTTTDNNLTQRQDLVKLLLEDHLTIFKALETDTTLSQLCIQSKVQSDSGIQFLEGQTGRYFLLEIEVRTEYLENLP